MSERRKVSTALTAFDAELQRLVRLDEKNQERYFAGPGRPGANRLSTSQMHLLVEAIFAKAFSRYELFMEEVFLLYCRGRPTAAGRKVRSYVQPSNYQHARSLVKSGMQFLEWNSPDKIIDRAKVYLETDNPIFLAVSTHQTALGRMRKVRNAIAHATDEAEIQFRKVVRDELGVAPLRPPTVGEFLIMTDARAPQPRYYLRSYMAVLGEVAQTAAR